MGACRPNFVGRCLGHDVIFVDPFDDRSGALNGTRGWEQPDGGDLSFITTSGLGLKAPAVLTGGSVQKVALADVDPASAWSISVDIRFDGTGANTDSGDVLFGWTAEGWIAAAFAFNDGSSGSDECTFSIQSSDAIDEQAPNTSFTWATWHRLRFWFDGVIVRLSIDGVVCASTAVFDPLTITTPGIQFDSPDSIAVPKVLWRNLVFSGGF